MMKIKVSVTSEIYGQVEVEANSYEEAVKIVDENFEDYCNPEKWLDNKESVFRICDKDSEYYY